MTTARRLLQAAALAAGLLLLAVNLVTIALSPDSWVDMRLLFTIVRDWWAREEPLYPSPDPESLAPGAHVYRYPPFWAVTVVPLVRHLELETAVAVWALLSLLVFFGGLAHLMRELRAGVGAVAALVLGLALMSPLYETFFGPTKELWVVGLLASAYALLEKRRNAGAAPLLALAVLFKVYPGFFAGYFLLARKLRFLVLAALWALALTLLPIPLTGTADTVLFHSRILPLLGGSSADAENVGVETLFGMLGLPSTASVEAARDLAPGRAPAAAWRLFVLGSVVAATAVGQRRALSARSRYLVFATWVAALLVVVPVCWANYQLLLVFPLSALLLWLEESGGNLAARAAGGLGLVALILVSLPLNDAVRDRFVAAPLPRADALATPFALVLQPELLRRLRPRAVPEISPRRLQRSAALRGPQAAEARARRRALGTPALVGLLALRPLAGVLAFLAALAASATALARVPSDRAPSG